MAVELSCLLANYSQSVISADVSALVELVRIPTFFKKKVFTACLGGRLALRETKDLGNNISTSYWFLPSATGSACIASIAPREQEKARKKTCGSDLSPLLRHMTDTDTNVAVLRREDPLPSLQKDT
jgi:hypothetical protein